MVDIDVVIVGGGVIGIATARAFAMAGREAVVLERSPFLGEENSSRNSGIVHGGVQYPPDSKKAKFCVEGNPQVFEFAEKRAIPHQRNGKLVVATTAAQIDVLKALRSNASANGIPEKQLILLDGKEARRYEPNVNCKAALYVGTSGTVDAPNYLDWLRIEAKGQDKAADFVPKTPFLDGKVLPKGGFKIKAGVEGKVFEFHCDMLINAAGMHAPAVARQIEGIDPVEIPHELYGFGRYAAFHSKQPIFGRPIYSVPVQDSYGSAGSVGPHSRADAVEQGGPYRIVLGPDILTFDAEKLSERVAALNENLRVLYPDDLMRHELIKYKLLAGKPEAGVKWISLFQAAGMVGLDDAVTLLRNTMRGFWKDAREEAIANMSYDYAGVRPKIRESADFMITTHGIPGLVCAYGMESPGLTSSIPAANHILHCAMA